MSFLGLSGPDRPPPPEPPRDPDAETVGLPRELDDKTPLGRAVRFLIGGVLCGLFAVPLTLIPRGFVDVIGGFGRPHPGARAFTERLSDAGVDIGLGLGLVGGCSAAIWGDRFLAPLFRYLRRGREPRP